MPLHYCEKLIDAIFAVSLLVLISSLTNHPFPVSLPGVGTLKIWTQDIAKIWTLLLVISGNQGNVWKNAQLDITAAREYWVGARAVGSNKLSTILISIFKLELLPCRDGGSRIVNMNTHANIIFRCLFVVGVVNPR